MSTSLRPVLRPSSFSSLSTPSSQPTYICQTCRSARLLRRPKRPYTFTQLVALSDGSAFTLRTTSPLPVYRSTRDTRNAPLWNPTSKDILSVETDEAGRLAGFRARFGTGFDAAKKFSGESAVESTALVPEPEIAIAAKKEDNSETSTNKVVPKSKKLTPEEEEDLFYEDDVNLLDMISQYGQNEPQKPKSAPPPPTKAAGKKGKK